MMIGRKVKKISSNSVLTETKKMKFAFELKRKRKVVHSFIP